MFFFVNQYLLSSNSSTEHAEIKRLKLFKKNNTEAKLVTRDFDNIIHSTLGRFGLDDSQLVNMFDFFADTVDYKGKECHVEDLNLPYGYQVSSGSNSRTVMDGTRLVAEIFFIGGTVGLVDHIDFYDAAGNITLREKFDIRGYKAVDIFFGQDNQVFLERYYKPNGDCYIERYYVQSTQNTPINSLSVLHYNGKQLYFDTLDDLFGFFLDELDSSVIGTNTFIADRAMAVQPVQDMHMGPKRYLWVPFNHVDAGQDPIKGKINWILENPMGRDINKWDGFIAMTEAQTNDLKKRIGNKAKVYHINGVPVAHTINRVNMSKRTPGKIIYVGRLGNDKQIQQLLEMFKQVHDSNPMATFDLYGYGNPQDVKNYKDYVKNAGLDIFVKFKGYQVKLNDAYDQAQLFVDASQTDGEPLAMGEALAHGVPVITYDYHYGPNEMVKNNVNGVLIKQNDQAKFVKSIKDLLKDTNKLQELSTNAYANLDDIDENTTWKQWQALIK